jgi:hypothetical protein
MPIGILYWVIYVIAVLFSGWAYWPAAAPGAPAGAPNFRPLGAVFVIFVLLFLIGWHDFGFVVHDGSR